MKIRRSLAIFIAAVLLAQSASAHPRCRPRHCYCARPAAHVSRRVAVRKTYYEGRYWNNHVWFWIQDIRPGYDYYAYPAIYSDTAHDPDHGHWVRAHEIARSAYPPR